MSDISTDQKLRLIQQIRQEHNQNIMSLRSRERILNGQYLTDSGSAAYANYSASAELSATSEQESTVFKSTFPLRFFLSCLLFLGYFMLWRSDGVLGVLNADSIRGEVNRFSEVNANLFDFIKDFPYTLTID